MELFQKANWIGMKLLRNCKSNSSNNYKKIETFPLALYWKILIENRWRCLFHLPVDTHSVLDTNRLDEVG